MTPIVIRVGAVGLTGAIAAASVASCAVPAGPSSQPHALVVTDTPSVPSPSSIGASPSATMVGSTVRQVPFVSSRYGYQLVAPGNWTATETPGSGGTHPDEPGVDTFRDGEGHILSIVGEPAAALTSWTCAINKHLMGDEHGLAVEDSAAIDVAGVPGRISEYHLEIRPYVIHYLTVEAVRNGVGLTLSFESTTRRDVEDRQILDDLLRDFQWS